MYCVKFCDPLCGKLASPREIVKRLKRLSGKDVVTPVEEAVSACNETPREAVSFAYSRRLTQTPYNCRFEGSRVFRGQN